MAQQVNVKFIEVNVTLKLLVYFVKAIFIGFCVYAFVEVITVISVESLVAVEQDSSAAEEVVIKASDKKATAACQEEGLWAKYIVWGTLGGLYTT